MKKHIINGHEMATLRVPKADHKLATLWVNIEPYVSLRLNSSGMGGECWSIKNGKTTIDTEIEGGHRLQNSAGKRVHYVGQEFLLTVPVFCLSKAGRKAAKEYEERQQ